MYRRLRIELTSKLNPVTKQPDPSTADPSALELKTFGKGVLSRTTRGQMEIEGQMIAATCFQKKGYEKIA